MRVCVYGLWHLGTVTAACLASRGITTTGLSESTEAAAALRSGVPPLYEQGLEDLMKRGLASGLLSFTDDLPAAISSADLIWIGFDTPVDDHDVADVDFVLDRIRLSFPYLKDQSVVLISSQMPVGSTAKLESEFASISKGRRVYFAYSPENLRLGDAITAFTKPERIVVGIRGEEARKAIEVVLAPFCDVLVWMRVESAEMVKHALNAFLATSITFTNEVAGICEVVAADMSEVENALRLDPRIGKKAYVRAGSAFGGGTLARDIRFLTAIAREHGSSVPVLSAVIESNERHKGWVVQQLRKNLDELVGKRIGILGLAYKAGTDSIRRSVAIDIIKALIEEGANVTAFDPKVSDLAGPDGSSVVIADTPEEVFRGSHAVVLATDWSEFRSLDFSALIPSMARRLLIDQNAFLVNSVSGFAQLSYVVGGRVQ